MKWPDNVAQFGVHQTQRHRSKRVAVQRTKRLVAFDPYVALWYEYLCVGIRWECLYDVVCDGDDALDDHFPTVDGVSERYNVPFADGSPRVYAEAVKEDDVVKRRSVWIEGRLTDGNEEKRKEEMKDRPAYFYLGLSLWCIHSE